MITMTCDVCGKPTDRNYTKDELNLTFDNGDDEQKTDHWQVKVIVLCNGGQPREICRKCLLDIINEMGREPKAVPPDAPKREAFGV